MKLIYSNIDLKATGENLKKIRIEKGYSVKELQFILGLNTPQAIYKWQRGKCLPTIDNLLVISSLFQMPIESLLIYKIAEDKIHDY